jgi:hypothetical protein
LVSKKNKIFCNDGFFFWVSHARNTTVVDNIFNSALQQCVYSEIWINLRITWSRTSILTINLDEVWKKSGVAKIQKYKKKLLMIV